MIWILIKGGTKLEPEVVDVVGQHSRASLKNLEKTNDHIEDLYTLKIASGEGYRRRKFCRA